VAALGIMGVVEAAPGKVQPSDGVTTIRGVITSSDLYALRQVTVSGSRHRSGSAFEPGGTAAA
jgi:hypothetical protein